MRNSSIRSSPTVLTDAQVSIIADTADPADDDSSSRVSDCKKMREFRGRLLGV